MPHAFISAPGSRGDVNPMLAIASELRRRDWQVHVAISEPYAELVTAIDCRVEVIGSREEFDQMIALPGLWRPLSGGRIIFKNAVPGFNIPYFKRLLELAPSESSVLIAHPLDFASRVFHQLYPRISLVNVHLAPTTLYDPQRPPRMTALSFELRRPPQLVRMLYACGDRLLFQRWLRPTLKTMFELANSTPTSRSLFDWWTTGTCTIGLFPDWFGSPTRPANLFQPGFPLSDGPEEKDLHQLNELLCGFDRAPLAFTPGTAHRHAEKFFRIAIEVCRRLDEPGLLLTSHPEQLPEQLPQSIRAMGYVPFASLLPRCRMLIHHGGIGTTSQSLSACIPQVEIGRASCRDRV